MNQDSYHVVMISTKHSFIQLLNSTKKSTKFVGMLTGDELDFSSSLLDAIFTDRRGHIVITLSDEILEVLTTPVFLEAVVKVVYQYHEEFTDGV